MSPAAMELSTSPSKISSSDMQSVSTRNDVALSLLCGGVAGAVAKTAVAPVERVKMSFQISSRQFTLARAFRHGQEIIRTGGLSSLWKGHSTTLIRVAPLAGISFAAHDYAEAELKRYLCTDRLPIIYKFLAGAIAGSTGTFLTYPLDVMRVRLALVPNSDWITALRMGGLYQGLTPTILGIIPYSGAAWMIKQTLLERFIGFQNRSPSLIESLAINAIAGLSGQFVTYPLDIVRRRMQMAMINSDGEYLSLRSTLQHLIKSEGYRGLAKGFSLNVIKGPVTMSLSLTTYDLMVTYFNKQRNPHNPHNMTAT